MSALRALAAAAPVAVFAAVGEGASDRVDDLCVRTEIKRVASPRHASVLLVAGKLRPADQDALRRLHDQLPHPRATLWWADDAPTGGDPRRVRMGDDPTMPLQELYRQLLTGEHRSEDDLLPDEPPAPWRGIGEYGQGGKGMMGGTPYGRPMPMTADDLRDGLALDAYTLRIGPFMPTLPAGLVLSLTLQGDVIQHACMESPPLWPALHMPPHATPAASADVMVLGERLRAGHHLRCVARLLIVLELAPLAERCWRTASAIEHAEPCSIDPLRKALVRSGAFAAIPAGLGQLEPPIAQALGGVALRAAGATVDAHQHDPAYRELDFHMLTQREGDVRARLRQWLDEAEQSMRLASRTDNAARCPTSRVDAHAPVPPDTSAGLDDLFTKLLHGLEWNEAMLVINSFDVAALRRMGPSTPSPPGAADGQHGRMM